MFSELDLADAVVDDLNWYLVNVRNTGFYRVNYDQENWERLITVLNDQASYTVR